VDKDETKEKINTIEDFIHAPKHQNSLNKFLAKTENPLENGAVGRLLLLSEEEVETIYQESIETLKKEMLDEEGFD
jgi:hypothetical protein